MTDHQQFRQQFCVTGEPYLDQKEFGGILYEDFNGPYSSSPSVIQDNVHFFIFVTNDLIPAPRFTLSLMEFLETTTVT